MSVKNILLIQHHLIPPVCTKHIETCLNAIYCLVEKPSKLRLDSISSVVFSVGCGIPVLSGEGSARFSSRYTSLPGRCIAEAQAPPSFDGSMTLVSSHFLVVNLASSSSSPCRGRGPQELVLSGCLIR